MRAESDLSGKILIAMPGMADPRFAHAVVLICAHSEDGAMGLVLNKPMRDLRFADLMEQLEIETAGPTPDLPLRIGGPVEPGRGFVLHDGAVEEDGAIRINAELVMSTTREVLSELAQGRGPGRAVLALGYAGWGAGQLDAEILANGWLTGEMDTDYAFGAAGDVWARALGALGIDPRLLSDQAGHA